MADTIRHVVLIGAGHAHLHLLKHAPRFAESGLTLTLIDPGKLSYSGLATSVLGGRCEPADDQIDPSTLAGKVGCGVVIRDRAIRVDRTGRIVHLASAQPIAYDLLSVNIGSEVPLDMIEGAKEHSHPVKPISNLFSLRKQLESKLAERQSLMCVAVIGGGATACEIAANLVSLARRCEGAVAVTIFASGSRLLSHHASGASASVMKAIQQRGIRVRTDARVTTVGEGFLRTQGQTFEADMVVSAFGLRPHGDVRSMGLPVDDAGGLRVDERLRCMDDDRIFGAGDCITFVPRGLPKVGVYGVRQAPVLLHNLIKRARGASLKCYQPQRRYLIILNLGMGEGLALWGRWHYRGRASRWGKDYLDRRFLRAYRNV